MEKDCLQRLLEEGCVDAKAYLECGVALFKKNDFSNAKRAMTQAISLIPNYASAFYIRGIIQVKLGNLKEAIADYDQAITFNPKDASAYFSRGVTQKKVGNLHAAIADLDQAITLGSDDGTTFFMRGSVKEETGDLKGALSDYDQAILKDQTDEMVYFSRGRTKGILGDLEGALADYDQVIILNPDLATTYYNRANIKNKLGNYRGALADYDQATVQDPKDVMAFFSRGMLKAILNDLEGAIADYDQAIILNPGFAYVFYMRANAQKKRGNLSGALADYDQAIFYKPEYAKAFYNRAVTKNQLKDSIGALTDYNQAIALNLKAAEVFYNRGNTKKILGDLKGAIADYDQAISVSPEYFEAFHNRGVVKLDLNNSEGALADFNQAIIIDPTNADTFHNRASAKFNLSLRIEALSDINEAIRLNPFNGTFYYHRGAIRSTTGFKYEVLQDYYRFLHLNEKKINAPQLRHLTKCFTYDFPAPFILNSFFEKNENLHHHVSFQAVISENRRDCRAALTFLRYIKVSKIATEFEVNKISALIHLGMGDPIRAYAMLDSLGDELPVQYFLMVAAEDILHEERSSIREFAVKAATEYAGAYTRDWYYAGRILQIAGDIQSALNCYDKSESYWPSAFAKAGITGVRPETREDFGNGLPVTVLEPDGTQWLNAVERAVLFYDLEEEISRYSGTGKAFPRFWEVWDVSQLIEPLRQLEMDLRENWLKQVFQKHFEAAYQERKPESKRFEHHEEVQDKFRQLKKSKTLTHDLSLLIHGNQWAPEECAALVEYFYLAGKLHIDDVFYLYFYLLQNSHRASTAANEGVDEWLKTFAEKLLSPLFQVLGIFGEAIAAGIGEALKVLFQKFIETKHSRIPPTGDGMTDFERFQSSFKQHILDTFEDLGEEAFFKLYPIQGFDRY